MKRMSQLRRNRADRSSQVVLSCSSYALAVILLSLFPLSFGHSTQAGVLAGAVHNWDAALDDTDNGLWEDTGSLANRDWNLSGPDAPNEGGPKRISVASATQIQYAYEFDGTDDTGMTQPENRSGDHDTTFELWFKPNGFPAGDVRTLFEHGNTNRGLSFGLSNDTLVAVFAFGNPTTPFEFDLDMDDNGIDNPDFIQVVGVVDDSNDQIRLYVDGAHEQVQSISSSADFTSNDDAGLGHIQGKGGGGLVSSAETWGGYFDGDIAIVREYRSAFGPEQVAQNYAAMTVPEPSSLLLALVATLGFVCLRRRRC